MYQDNMTCVVPISLNRIIGDMRSIRREILGWIPQIQEMVPTTYVA